ncbi:MAG: carbohydrate ABC transporter permease [Nocardioidaceae bacterium]|jgi:alpha-glucoside transport system permease protein|nr:carbohydrate ABC transporter permease [Nocardioidaceae bacterium]
MSATTPQTTATVPVRSRSKSRAISGGHQDPTRKGGWGTRVALIVACVLWTLPTLGLLITSFRSKDDAVTSGWWSALANPFSTQWTFANFDAAIFDNNMGVAFVNSIVVAIPATVIPIMFAAFAAYAFTFMRFRGRDFLFVVVVSLLVVPIQVAFVPMLRLFGGDGLDIIGQFIAVWLLHTGFGMPLAIYILRNYMATLPRTIIESADIDGATHFQTFWRLIVPMSVPALAAFAIFQFLWVWNDLLIALLFLGTGNPVVTVQLQQLLGRLGEGWQLVAAGAFFTMTVPLFVFFTLQRFFVRGLTAGSVKG